MADVQQSYDPDGRTVLEFVRQSGVPVPFSSDESTVAPFVPADAFDHLEQTVVVPRAEPSDRDRVDYLGRYRITGHLGQGGMGEVLEVEDPTVGRKMAAKVIRGRVSRRSLHKFIMEAQVTGQLEHPNTVPMYELGLTPEGQLYYTMKKVHGETLEESLRTALRREKTNRMPEFLQVFLKICDAVAFAHSKGVIHRDLKPSNVMVGRFGEVHVMDWGLAKIVGEPDLLESTLMLDLRADAFAGELGNQLESTASVRTMHGEVVGTPAYMSPEQARGEIYKLDQRSDIYALGAILYEVLTLVPPYDAESVRELINRVAQGKLRPPSRRAAQGIQVPRELEAVVMKAMSLVRAKRYQDVGSLTSDISAFLEGRALAAATYSQVELMGKAMKNRKAWVIAMACAALAVLLTLLLAQRQIRAERDRADRALASLRSERAERERPTALSEQQDKLDRAKKEVAAALRANDWERAVKALAPLRKTLPRGDVASWELDIGKLQLQIDRSRMERFNYLLTRFYDKLGNRRFEDAQRLIEELERVAPAVMKDTVRSLRKDLKDARGD